MRIDHVSIRNFRNLAQLDVALQAGTVLVGANRAGKSNLIHAIRLVLDPTLSNSDRYLTREDFWDGLTDGTSDWDPMAQGEEIEISLSFSGFDHEPETLAALSDALIEGDPMIARLTYRYSPRSDIRENGRHDYEWRIFGGDREGSHIPSDLRRYIWVAYLQALRDAQGDLASWNRSPLRPLLQAASEAASEADLGEAASAIADAHRHISELEPIKRLAEAITNRTTSIVGPQHALEAELGIAPLDPLRLIRGLRVFVDGDAHRSLSSASLGTLNVLHLALLELGLDLRLAEFDIAHVLMMIEEPEAHLHPHLQRLIFGRLLREEDAARTVLLTTHSPHIASVAHPRGLVVLRTDGRQTKAAAAADADLTDEQWDDIARYMDATRGEIVFAENVLLVEGFSEQVLVPPLAAAAGINTDKEGISVCAIHGTHFSSYVRFLEALEIPWAVITDADPRPDGEPRGVVRARQLAESLSSDIRPEDAGIFVGDTTFEFDLLMQDGNLDPTIDAITGLIRNQNRRDQLESWRLNPPDQEEFMHLIDLLGKGRVAQRLAQVRLRPPQYISDALEYLIS